MARRRHPRPALAAALRPAALAPAALALMAAPALAAMPHYDVAAHCDEIAGFGGTYSEAMYASCFDMEQESYDRLKPGWDALPGRLRDHCDRIARFGGPGSYAMLEGCVEMETQAASTDKTFEY